MELYPRLSIIAEPGTYYCASAFCLATMIIGKRVDNFIDPNNNELDQNNNELDQNNNELDQNYNSYKHVHYYINDGVFGPFFGPLSLELPKFALAKF